MKLAGKLPIAFLHSLLLCPAPAGWCPPGFRLLAVILGLRFRIVPLIVRLLGFVVLDFIKFDVVGIEPIVARLRVGRQIGHLLAPGLCGSHPFRALTLRARSER